MNKLKIRSIQKTDIESLANFDADFETDYVWQMDKTDDSSAVGVNFRKIRLPRAMQVDYPYSCNKSIEEWSRHDKVFVAELEGQALGYLCIYADVMNQMLRVPEIVVDANYRRKGVGSRLLLAAFASAKKNGVHRIVVEVQSKNHPAIAFLEHAGLEFNGFCDNYFPNQDIMLLYSKRL